MMRFLQKIIFRSIRVDTSLYQQAYINVFTKIDNDIRELEGKLK